MTIICVITGVVELLLLITVTGVLVTVTALFSLLELMIITINPICLYLVRQSGQIFSCLIIVTIRRVQQISRKMCSTNEQTREPIVATIEPLPPEIEKNLPSSQETYVSEFVYNIVNNLPDSQGNDDERSHQSEEIQSM